MIKELYLKELEDEAGATRRCLERVPENLFSWKPHEKSMEMIRLAYTVASIPRWIARALDDGEINFNTFKNVIPTTNAELVKCFDDCMAEARTALKKISDEDLQNGMFYLKMGDKVLMSGTKLDTVSSSINHGAHHRGHLTVYLRLNNIPVPAIYGPSGDEREF